MKRLLVFAAAVSAMHFAATAICFSISFSLSRRRFDRGGEATLVERIAGSATELLMSPLYWLWTPLDEQERAKYHRKRNVFSKFNDLGIGGLPIIHWGVEPMIEKVQS